MSGRKDDITKFFTEEYEKLWLRYEFLAEYEALCQKYQLIIVSESDMWVEPPGKDVLSIANRAKLLRFDTFLKSEFFLRRKNVKIKEVI